MAKRKLPLPGSKEYEEAIAAGVMPSKATRSITRDFLDHVSKLLDLAKQEPDSSTTRRDETRRSTQYAIPAYVCAAAAIECFVNELFLSDIAHELHNIPGLSGLGDAELEELEYLQPGVKLILLPAVFAGKALKKSDHIYGEAVLLFKLRNCLVHYKFKQDEAQSENVAAALAGKGIAFAESMSGTPWVDRVSTVNGICWAYNTAVTTIKSLIALLPDQNLMRRGHEAVYRDLAAVRFQVRQ